MQKDYFGWVVKLPSGAYYTGDATAEWPYSDCRAHAKVYRSKDDAFAGIHPRIKSGRVPFSSLTFVRLYRWSE